MARIVDNATNKLEARDNRLDRITGCLLGGAIGDGFGSRYEGQAPPIDVDFSIEPRLTDDTQLTLATCEGIIAAGFVEPASIAAAMARWFRERRLTGVGGSTFKALQELVAGHHWALTGAKGDRAAGNGAAMRIAPLAFFLDIDDFDQRRLLRDVARITHQHEEAYVGALAIVAAVQFAATDNSPLANMAAYVHRQLPDSFTRDRLQSIHEMQCSSVAEFAEKFGNTGYVAESVSLSILGASRLEESGLIGTFQELIACGGDTDTVASMAGQIMGARTGFGRLAPSLFANLPEVPHITRLANELATVQQR